MSCPAEVLRQSVRDVILGLHHVDGELSASEAFLHPEMPHLEMLHPAWSTLLHNRACGAGVGPDAQMYIQ
eukprot:4082177-Heterocapsa_arctica.AAC.1